MDSRTIKAALKELAASPRPIAEADFDPKTGALTRVVFEHAGNARASVGLVSSQAPGSNPGTGSERDKTPKTAKPKKSAVASLKLAPPEWVAEIEAPEAIANG